MKKGLVVFAKFDRIWPSKYGDMYVFKIMFDNGDSGEYNSKTQEQNKFIVDKEATYEKTPTQGDFPDKIKPVTLEQREYQKGGGSGGPDVKAMMMSYAKDLIESTAESLAKPEDLARNTIYIFFEFMKAYNGDYVRFEGNKKPTELETTTDAPPPGEEPLI